MKLLPIDLSLHQKNPKKELRKAITAPKTVGRLTIRQGQVISPKTMVNIDFSSKIAKSRAAYRACPGKKNSILTVPHFSPLHPENNDDWGNSEEFDIPTRIFSKKSPFHYQFIKLSLFEGRKCGSEIDRKNINPESDFIRLITERRPRRKCRIFSNWNMCVSYEPDSLRAIAPISIRTDGGKHCKEKIFGRENPFGFCLLQTRKTVEFNSSEWRKSADASIGKCTKKSW